MADSFPFFLVQVLNGVQYGLLLFLVASGLTLVFGIMGIINLAHGSFYMVGAYLAYWLAQETGNFGLAILLALPLAIVLALALELLFRPLYTRDHLYQALLDLYTIQSEIGRLDDLHVVMVGDLSHGRTVHSLAYLLALYHGLRVTLVAPEPIRMSPGVITHLLKHGAEVSETEDLMGAIADADIVYQTRIQLERFSEPWDESEDQRRNFRISEEVMSRLPRGAIVMHPLPRVGEIDVAVDRDPRAAYFRQARNGVAVRMAVLKMLLPG
jgi:hypothetical protein